MNFPRMNSNPTYKVSVPELSGGMNTISALNMVDDNQLTDSLNMWWKDGALRTRDGFKNVGYNVSPPLLSADFSVKKCGEITFKDGKKYATYVIYNNTSINIMGISASGEILKLPIIYFSDDPEQPAVDAQGNVYFSGIGGEPLVFSGKASALELFKIYIIVPRYYYDTGGYHDNLVLCATNTTTVTDATDNCYVPTVYVNGKGNNYSTLPTTDTTEYAPASMFEGINLISRKFKAYFKTDGVSQEFILPIKDLDSRAEVVVNYLKSDGTYDNWIQPYDGYKSNTTSDGLFIEFVPYPARLSICSTSTGAETPLPASSSQPNNLEIIVYMKESTLGEKISKMTTSTWFGGTDGGGGTRLFVSGNPDEPNLIHWTDLNQPLYFPENNYAYVGDSAQKVTGFGKQSDMLVIFKPHETYYSTYVAGNSYTVADVVNGAVTDVTAAAATFPLYQIHSAIGCDLPDTIQLCSNKLVWATTDKKVYTLATTYTYSEKNIYTVSESIERKFKDLDFSTAFALDYNHHYLLFVGTKIFVLDYGTTYFKYVTSYSKDDNLQKGINWYEWDSAGFDGGCSDESSLGVYSVNEAHKTYEDGTEYNNYALSTYFTLLSGSKDDTYVGYGNDSINAVRPILQLTDISSMLQTKLFDFKSFNAYKCIERLYLGLGANEESTINVSFITERGTNEDARTIVLNDYADNYSPELIKTISLLPSQPRIIEFGLKLESDGTIAIGGIVINYRMLGSVK